MPALSGPGGKFSLFKGALHAAPVTVATLSDDESDEEFFSRSKHTYAILAAEEEERKRRIAEREKDDDYAHQSSSTPGAKKQKLGDDVKSPGGKTPDGEMELGSLSEASVADHAEEFTLGKASSSGDSQINLSRRGKPVTSEEAVDLKAADRSGFVSSAIEDSAEAEPAVLVQGLSSPTTTSVSGETPTSNFPEQVGNKFNSSGTHVVTSEKKLSKPQDCAQAKAVITILIRSKLPNTSALRVQRRLDQRLKEVRLEWCKRQNYDKLQVDDTVLTWRGKLVYDSTSCQSLGIGFNTAGEITQGDAMDLIGDVHQQIEMEAMTRQMYKNLKEVKAKAARLDVDATEEADPAAGPGAITERRVRLFLKSKDHEEVELMVKESHTIERLIYAFRKANGLGEEHYVSIHFDGEELDHNATIVGSDIGDKDTLDVYLRPG